MKKILSVIIGVISSVALFAEQAKVITYPAPPTECVKSGYKVLVNGQHVDVYKATSQHFWGTDYFFCYFDFKGKIEVSVSTHNRANFSEKTELFPAREFKWTKKNVKFTADKPFKVCLLRAERSMPLIIFGNPIEKNIPSKDDPNVIFFDKGVHATNVISLRDNQTLYIAGGAVVKAKIDARGDNIKIRGRGILSGELNEKWTGHLLNMFGCKNLKINGIIAKDSSDWTLVVNQCQNVRINNFKICGAKVLQDDGIDICNSSDVIIKNSFVRVQDDVIAIKGLTGTLPSEKILVKNCILWTDCANIFRIGYECKAEAMRNIKAEDIYVPFYSKNYAPPEHTWANAIIWFQAANDMPMHDITISNMLIRSDGSDIILICANPRITDYLDTKTPGKIYNCTVKNVNVVGNKGKFKGTIFVKGYDAEHGVSNLKIENIKYFGEKITKDSPNVRIGDFTKNIHIR